MTPEKSEPCHSKLIDIFAPLTSDNKKTQLPLKTVDFIKSYLVTPNFIDDIIKNITDRHDGFSEKHLRKQFADKEYLIAAIENFMLSNWDEIELTRGDNEYSNIVYKTLGYTLADEEIKQQLTDLFNVIEKFIRDNISDSDRKHTYGRTLFGINEAQSIESWYNENISRLRETKSTDELLDAIWDLLHLTVCSEASLKLTNIEEFKSLIYAWIMGEPYCRLLKLFSSNDIKLIWGRQRRKITIDKVVDVFYNKIAFEGCKVINALYEFASQNAIENDDLMRLLLLLQKQLKYGLTNECSIVLYELGFCDRVIAQDLQVNLNLKGNDKPMLIHAIRANVDAAKQIISEYPAYFQMKLDNLI